MAGRVWQSELRHVSVLHGTGYYGAYVKIDPRRFPSSEAAPPVPGNQIFYMAQEELLRERQPGSGWTFTTWRPPLLLGFAVGSALNIVNAVACHAVICRELGEPLS